MKSIIDKLGIDETYTKEVKKPKYYTKFRDIVPPVADYNFMADLIVMPKTKNKYMYLFVCVDLGNGEFDIEPMKNKEPSTVLKALKNMCKRKYINMPEYTLATDDGSEFKGIFHKYLYDHNIYHKVSLPNRHTQTAVVETLNKQLVRIFNGYMNKKEEETQKPYNEWTDILEIVRKELNKFRLRPTYNPITYKYPIFNATETPKYDVGDIVYRQSDTPLNALGRNQPTNTFRIGDYRFERIPHKIIKVLYYSGKVPYRFMLEGIPNASFTETQLLPAKKEETETKYKVREILGKKIIKKKVYYLIWWSKFLKKDATYEPEEQLIKDGFQDDINNFNELN